MTRITSFNLSFLLIFNLRQTRFDTHTDIHFFVSSNIFLYATTLARLSLIFFFFFQISSSSSFFYPSIFSFFLSFFHLSFFFVILLLSICNNHIYSRSLTYPKHTYAHVCTHLYFTQSRSLFILFQGSRGGEHPSFSTHSRQECFVLSFFLSSVRSFVPSFDFTSSCPIECFLERTSWRTNARIEYKRSFGRPTFGIAHSDGDLEALDYAIGLEGGHDEVEEP